MSAKGIRNCKAKLSENDVTNIFKSKLGSVALGRFYGMNKRTIERIKTGELWASVTDRLVGE